MPALIRRTRSSKRIVNRYAVAAHTKRVRLRSLVSVVSNNYVGKGRVTKPANRVSNLSILPVAKIACPCSYAKRTRSANLVPDRLRVTLNDRIDDGCYNVGHMVLGEWEYFWSL